MARPSKNSTKPILLFSFDYSPNLGGIARLCEDIAHGLINQNRVVTVLTESNGRGIGVMNESGVKVHRVPSLRPLREIMALKAMAIEYSDHLVLCGTWYPEGLISMLGSRNAYINLLHGAELLKSPNASKEAIYSKLRPRILKNARMNIANSDFTANLGKEIAPSSKTLCLPLGVDLNRLPLQKHSFPNRFDSNRRLELLTVARLHDFKGIDTILSALSKLRPEDLVRLNYTIVGEGPHRSKMEKMVTDLKLDDVVEFKGKLSHEDLKIEFAKSDLFAMCTRLEGSAQSVEGFGLVFIEALTFGVPVVGTRSGGIPTAIKEGEGGWLIEEHGVDQLKDLLVQFLENPFVLSEQAEKGQDRIKSINNMNVYTDNLIHLLSEAQS